MPFEREEDTTLRSADASRELLNSIEFSESLLRLSCETMDDVLDDLRGQFEKRNSDVGALFDSLAAINAAAVPLTQDLEIAISENKVSSHALAWMFAEVEIDVGRFRITVKPAGTPSVLWSRHLGPTEVMPDCLQVNQPLAVEIEGSSPRIVHASINLAPQIAANASLEFVQTCGTRFSNESGELTDPLAIVPVADNLRRDARKQLTRLVADQISSFSLELPKLPMGMGHIRTHTYSIGRNFVIVGRGLAKRRTRIELFDPRHLGSAGRFGRRRRSFDTALRVGRGHVQKKIDEEVRNLGATAQSVVFHHGYLTLTGYKRQVERRCHVKVTVQAWIDYRMRLENDLVNTIFADMHWTSWRYEYEIKRCWPKCGDISRQVERTTESEISKYLHETFDVADLSGQANRAIGQIVPVGMEFYLET